MTIELSEETRVVARACMMLRAITKNESKECLECEVIGYCCKVANKILEDNTGAIKAPGSDTES